MLTPPTAPEAGMEYPRSGKTVAETPKLSAACGGEGRGEGRAACS